MKNSFYKKERGITLIALVITIIVLLILAGVSISMLSGENGILNRAAEAKEETGTAQEKEEEALNSYEEMINGYVDGSTGNSGNGGDTGTTEPEEPENPEDPPAETISTTENYVGYYADLEGDGTVDGIIYADLVAGPKGDGQWTDSNGNYKLPEVKNAKNYYVSQESYEGAFGTKAVLSPTGTENDRFYVMALEDFTTDSYSKFSWYTNASGKMTDYSAYTSRNFGTGKSNTEAMITKWNSSGYGTQYERDMWGVIQDKVDDGWFVPSKAEWAAFGEELQITSSNYVDYELSYYYWSSSQTNTYGAWSAYFRNGFLYDGFATSFECYVRLCTTF